MRRCAQTSDGSRWEGVASDAVELRRLCGGRPRPGSFRQRDYCWRGGAVLAESKLTAKGQEVGARPSCRRHSRASST